VERGPLPPHERTWRHPSELAADETALVRSDPGGRSVRVAALTAGTFGLLAVGVLALWVTPSRGSPVAVESAAERVEPQGFGSVTTLLLDATVDADRAVVSTVMASTEVASTLVQAVASLAPVDATAGVAVTTFAPASTVPTAATPALATVPVTTLAELFAAALATPVDGGMALVTAQAVDGRRTGDTVSVELASGRTGIAEIVALLERAVVVALSSDLTGDPVHAIADDAPGAHDRITVLLDEPITVTLAELAGLDVPEGTPVLDADGELVGLCTDSADGTTALALVGPDADDLPGATGPADTTDDPGGTGSSAPSESTEPATTADSTVPGSEPAPTTAP